MNDSSTKNTKNQSTEDTEQTESLADVGRDAEEFVSKEYVKGKIIKVASVCSAVSKRFAWRK